MAVRMIGFEGLANTLTTSDQTAPSIVSLGGRFVISWTHANPTVFFADPSGAGVRAQVFNADGSKLGSELAVNTTTLNDQRLPAVAALPASRFVDVFDSGLVGNDFSNVDIRARLFDVNGSPVVNGVTANANDFLVNSTTPNFQSNPDVATLIGGNFVVTFASNDGGVVRIRARLFDFTGTPVVNGVTADTNDFLVSPSTFGGQRGESVAALVGGGFVVSYSNQVGISFSVLEARVFDSSGNPLTGPIGVANLGFNFTTSETTGLSGGGFVVTWHDAAANTVRGRLHDSIGTAVVVPGATDGTGVFDISAAGGNDAEITSLPSGFVVTWVEGTNILGQLFDATAHKVGNKFLLNTTVAGFQNNPTVTVLGDENLVFAWADPSQTGGDTSGSAIRYQIVDPNAPAPPPDSFDGNAMSDILVQNDDGTAAVWQMNGLTVVANTNVSFNPGPTWHVRAAGDLNGDTRADILWQNDDGTPSLWLTSGPNAIAQNNIGFNPGPSWHIVTAADFNADGKADILWQNDSGAAGIWLMDGFNRIADNVVGFNPGPTWHVITSGDFNGDGKADILWQNDSGAAGIWLMDGLNVIADSGVGFNPGPSWNVQSAGDFNGDGKADILWQNDNGAAGIWMMDGFTVIADSGLAFNPGPTWQIHKAGDYNGDGKADILWQNENGTPGIWLMDGFTVISENTLGFNPGASWHIVPPHHDLG